MNSRDEEIVQNTPPFQKTVFKLTCDNLDSCKRNPMASPVILKTERKCHFCKIKENNKLKYGPLYSLNQIVAHYYCVLLSTRMKQNGKDDEGIMGFLLRDINLELRRSKKVSCVYCREKNATVKCAHQGCKKVFHYPCGLESGALSRFRNDFISFCYQHRPKQKIPKKILEEVENTELICAICYEAVDSHDRIDSLWAPCCLKTWYHRSCVQKLAQSSGYFFRCATCNDTEKFKSYMEDNGIFVPQQDASWELVPNAYEELLVRHGRCDADHCKCPKGREENVEDTRWEIILCRFCGSQGIHVGCGNLKFSDPQWECPTCKNIMKADSESKSKSKSKPKPKPKPKSKAKSKKVEEEYKSDLAVKKPASKSGDQPATAARKRKLSGQQEVTDKRKRGDDSSEDDRKDCTGGNKSTDEFYIRIPEFLLPGRKSDKPHTATKPDENENESEQANENNNNNRNENGREIENENEKEGEGNEEDEEDEDVDVITYDAAWLMVEEVLSRVKPAPLSHKIRLIRKKCFSYHFDPFDVREEKTEIIDLASNKDDKEPAEQPTEDTDSDIEIIAEFLVNDRKTGKNAQQKSKTMEIDNPGPQPSNAPDVVEVPGPSEGGEEEIEERGPAEAPRGTTVHNISDDETPAPEISDIFDSFGGLEDFPTTSGFGMEFENSAMSNPDETMQFNFDTDEEEEELGDDFGCGSFPYDVDLGAEADKSEESSDDEATRRRVGSKQRGSKLKSHFKAKRRRMTANYVRAQRQYNFQCLIPNPNLAADSQVIPGGESSGVQASTGGESSGVQANTGDESSDLQVIPGFTEFQGEPGYSQVNPDGESSFNPVCTGEPTFDNNTTLNLSLSELGTINPQAHPSVIVTNTLAGFVRGGDSVCNSPISSTMMMSVLVKMTSSSSHSQVSTSCSTVASMKKCESLDNRTDRRMSWIQSTAISALKSTSSPMNVSETETSRPSTPPMHPFEMDTPRQLFDAETDDGVSPRSDSRTATPLPSLQFLTNFRLPISPLLSQSSNSSSSQAPPVRGQRLFQNIDVSSSSEASNDGFPEPTRHS